MHEIDFVIPWVDGGDPAWQQEMRKFTTPTGDRRDARYRDWGLLPFWFRAVEAYAPWVRKIHFITWGHVPAWLHTAHPKLHIVRHQDYLPPAYLPTFNSHTIELNLHRIDGLAEHFVYFNDDVFLTRSVAPSFFFRNGQPCDCFSLESICFAPNAIGWINGCNLSLINAHFPMRPTLLAHWRQAFNPRNGVKKVAKTALHMLASPWFPGLHYEHTANAFCKQTLQTVWAAEPHVLDATSRCRFREAMNVSQLLFKYWQLASGAFAPCGIHSQRCFHLTDEAVAPLCEAIRCQRYAVLCINDTDELQDLPSAIRQIRAAFAQLLPNACSFEIQNGVPV